MASKLVTGPLDSYLCPICLEVPPADVFECKNGHVVCSGCVKKLKICGQCRVSFCREPKRNRAFENILDEASFPCSNENCTKVFSRNDLQRHKEVCEYRPLNICPKLGNKSCQSLIHSGDELWKHLQNNHEAQDKGATSVIRSRWPNWIAMCVNICCRPRHLRSRYLFTSDDEHFLLNIDLSRKKKHCRSPTDIGINGCVLTFTVIHLGDCPEKADEFQAEVTVSAIYKSAKARPYSWSGLPINYKSVDVYSDICPSVSLPVSYFKRSVESLREFKESEDKTMEFDVVLEAHVSKSSLSSPSQEIKRAKLDLESANGSNSTEGRD